MNITKIISKTFDSRLKQIDLYASQASEIQHRVLSRLTRQAAQTEWGRKYDYSSIRNYEDFRKRVPIQTYEEIKPYVERLRAGEQNLLWPSEIRWFAKSSGTTNDKSKFPSAKRHWKTFITEEEKTRQLFISASIRIAIFSPARD